ncbi:Hypothetical predicted protein [Mytilus galloprovincialis]|uniref:Myb-like domain-containing protein n=1 Tax=Mytilus galloprovincialis TaxID=29158 RepID=A0A8B6C1Z4_MYTGA|nr:Hypothetical predicted protein [Mytilus galloprovincialis]
MRNNKYNKSTLEEKENLLTSVTECTCNDSTEWKSVTESLNVMFGSYRTAKSCQNQYKRIMAFKDSENKVEMVNASCQTDISLNPNDNFVFMKMDEEILELRTNTSDSHDSVDTAYESESSSSVLRTMLLDDSFLPCLTSTPKKHEKIVDEKGEGKVMPKENKARVGSDHSYISSLQIKPAKRHIGAPGKRVEKFNKIIPHLTDTTKSKVITTKDIVMLRHTMSTTRNTKNMSSIIMSIEPLREAILDNISNSVGDRPNEMRNKKKGYTSYLMEKGPESLEELNFEKVIEEMKQKFPEVLQILICIMLPKEKRSSEIALANILPRLAMIYGMMMQSRYHELSSIQRVIAMCLADNICDQSVSIINI